MSVDRPPFCSIPLWLINGDTLQTEPDSETQTDPRGKSTWRGNVLLLQNLIREFKGAVYKIQLIRLREEEEMLLRAELVAS